ncbi:MAG: polysaccharide export protein [Proteobacteria bacterium]|nr:polysaccharide export protein [Pseudomonadota bacterium]
MKGMWLWGALLLAGCASSTPAPMSPDVAVVTSQLPAPASAASAAADTPADEVAPQDVLDVAVFQVPDLTRTVRVNLAGEISLPLVGSIAAGGKTVREVELEIAERLRQKYMRNPNVTVFIKEKHKADVVAQRLTVEGAVKQPGVFEIKEPVTLLQAIALARGVEETANLKGVIVFRNVDNQRMAARFDLGAIRKGQAADPDIYPNDIVVVDDAGTRGRDVLRAIVSSLPILSVFRPF